MRTDVDGPQRIGDEIATALSAVPCVSAVALFGSLADGCADAWSDVDMLVACDDIDSSMWAVAAALRAAKSVLFYRPFTTARQPSGRYWFEDESPFHKIDISFDSVEEYDALLQGGGRLGHPMTAREVYRRQGAAKPVTKTMQATPLIIDEREQEVGKYIYQSLLSLKLCFRGGGDTKGFDNLQAAANELSRDTMMAGGRIGELVHMVNFLLCLFGYTPKRSIINIRCKDQYTEAGNGVSDQ